MKRIFIGILISSVIIGCKTDLEEVVSEQTINEEIETIDEYKAFLKSHKIKDKKAWAFQYKFGEPLESGLLIYETNYDSNGNLLDSIVYNSNKISFHEKYEYNVKNELIVRRLLDSLGVEVQRSERLFDSEGNESGFKMFSKDSLFYKQQREYNNKSELTRLAEYDASGISKLITEFLYNENGDLLSSTELDAAGNILNKITYSYDSNGNKTSIANYNSTGDIAGKTLLKDYIAGNAKRIEKYDAYDSLYASYQYEYNSKGEETKSIIFNGIGQVMRQSNTTFDENGNKILFEIYEGEVGFLGKDEILYNEEGKEVELIIYDGKNNQAKRKLTTYNEKGLVFEEENYNKVDEPIYKFRYEYQYFK